MKTKKLIKYFVIASMFIFAVRQIMMFNDIYLSLYLLFISFCVSISKD